MGLDTTHDCWHGAYSAFSRFRDAVALAAKKSEDYTPDYHAHPLRAFQGWWDDDHPFTHPLDIFFIHSDCDGYIFPQDAQTLIPALTRLLPFVEGDDWPGRSNQSRLAEFIAGLQRAVDEWEIVRFH